MLTFAAQHFLTGLDPWWMKQGNVALHALNALLVLALVGKLLGLAAPHASTDRVPGPRASSPRPGHCTRST
jgi:protein O-mannosyl-transferase